MFYREKKITCGKNYREVDIIPRTLNGERAAKGKRKKKHKISAPKQTALNEKNSRRYLVQLLNGNFTNKDFHVSLTYNDKNLPSTIEEAEKEVKKYLRRVAYRRKNLGLEKLKYVLVTEYKLDPNGGYLKRVHHHIVMNGGISRNVLEDLWTKKKINWRKYAEDKNYTVEHIGYVNTDKLQLNDSGLEALAKYITKNPQGKKRWSSSRNLERPFEQRTADHKYTKRKIINICRENDGGYEFFEKKFRDWNIRDIKTVYYENTGWHIYLKMWKKKE